MNNPGNGWEQWGRHVLTELERQDKCNKELEGKLNELTRAFIQQGVEIAMLKVKASVWGLIAGLIPATIALIYWIVKK